MNDNITPEEAAADDDQRIAKALSFADGYAYIDGAHHKQWVIDQMVRALTGCPEVKVSATDARGVAFTYEKQGESAEYRKFIGADDDEDRGWDEGIAP